MGTEVTLVENLPMLLNLGDFGLPGSSPGGESVIGHATLYKDIETEQLRLDIRMNDQAAYFMEHLVEIADLKAVGFAGIMKRPEGHADR